MGVTTSCQRLPHPVVQSQRPNLLLPASLQIVMVGPIGDEIGEQAKHKLEKGAAVARPELAACYFSCPVP